MQDRGEFDYDRTVALSDGVFAIALTLLVLNITVPSARPGHSLGRLLLDHHQEFGSYGVSFGVISLLWMRHHRFFASLARIDGRLTVLNLLYLGLVALLPYPTRVLGLYGERPAAVVFYAATVAVITLVGGWMRLHALKDGLVSDEGRRALDSREHWLLTPGVFLLSIPVAFLDTRAAALCWLLLLAPLILGRMT